MSRLPDDQAASDAEVEAAITTLTTVQLIDLKRYAVRKIVGLGRKALGRDWQDLLNTALERTVGRDRRWNKAQVDFRGHLRGVMRSIASHWREEFEDCEPRLESELVRLDASGKPRSPIDRVPDRSSEPGADLVAQELLQKFEELLTDDEIGLQILWGLRDEMSPTEIRDLLALDTKGYETAVKRVRRRIDAYLNRGMEHA